jgi:hypothetical protein
VLGSGCKAGQVSRKRATPTVRSPLCLAPTFRVRGQRAYVARNRNHGEDDAEQKEKPFAGGFGVAVGPGGAAMAVRVVSRIPLRCIRTTMGTLRISVVADRSLGEAQRNSGIDDLYGKRKAPRGEGLWGCLGFANSASRHPGYACWLNGKPVASICYLQYRRRRSIKHHHQR